MQIVQSQFCRGSRRCRILTDDGLLEVQQRDGRALKQFSLRLDLLHDAPTRVRCKAPAALIASCIFGVLCLFALGGVLLVPETGAKASAGFFVCLMGFAAIASFLRWRQQSGDVLFFYNRFSGQPVVSLFHDEPDKRSFASFVAA